MNQRKIELIVSVGLIVIILIILVVGQNRKMEGWAGDDGAAKKPAAKATKDEAAQTTASTKSKCESPPESYRSMFKGSFNRSKSTTPQSLNSSFNNKNFKLKIL